MRKLPPEKKKEYTGLLILALIVAIFSFPEIDLEYSTGIDPPLKWLFNHLFSEGHSLGKDIIFPHGPLAFFMYPLANNFILSVVVTLVLQVVFVYLLFYLFDKEKWQFWILTAVIAWFIFSISNFNQLVISNISVAYLLYLKSGKPLPKYWGLALTAFAFYVKAYIAIIAGTLAFSLLAIEFFWKRNYKQSLIDASVVILTMLIFWLLLYNQLAGFIHYCVGMFHLAGDNSAAAAFHPINNWLLVLPFLLVVFTVPFLQKTNEGKSFGLLFSLSFFAAWKYGMAREDFYHIRTFLFFIAISMILFLVFNRKKWFINLVITGIAITLFAVNMRNVENPQSLTINYSGIRNFIQFVSSYSEIKAKSERQNIENIAVNRLPETVRSKIGNATVDIYPWDYTIVAANQLNWKPRPVIQSYASYTQWLDKKNDDHFESGNAPEYFVFGLNNGTSDLNGGKLASIDYRYLLNDEPQTMIGLIRNYERIYSDVNFLVYHKRKQAIKIHSVIGKTQSSAWNEWFAVQDTTNCFTRLKLHFERSFSGRIKSILYKDEQFYVYLKASDGSTLKYRIVPQNAIDGIWISPFFTSAGDRSPAKTITEVMMTCSDKSKMKNSFSYEWEYYDTDKKTINDFLGKDSTTVPEIFVNEYFNLESGNAKWSNFNIGKVKYDSVDHQKYYPVEPEGFSPTLKFDIDSLTKLPARITVDCWLKTSRAAHSSLVIETENAKGEKIWHGVEINRQIIDENVPNYVSSYLDLDSQQTKATVYVWNNGKKPVMIFGMNARFIKHNNNGE